MILDKWKSGYVARRKQFCAGLLMDGVQRSFWRITGCQVNCLDFLEMSSDWMFLVRIWLM